MAVYNHLWEYWFAFQGKSKKKLPQSWLAEQVGISVFTLRKYLNNTTKSYDPDVLDKLCNVLGIPIEDFFYRAERENNPLERNQAVAELGNTTSAK